MNKYRVQTTNSVVEVLADDFEYEDQILWFSADGEQIAGFNLTQLVAFVKTENIAKS